MRAFGLRVPVVLAATAAVLAVLFFMQFLLQRQTVALPLATRLHEVPGVMGQPQVTANGGVLNVTVQLGLVPNLQTTYKDLMQAAGADGSRVNLRIKDNRSPALSADFAQLMFPLDQGRGSSDFTGMDQQFTAEAKNLDLTGYDLLLGQSHVFVTLVQGSHYLYAILPLTLGQGAAAAATGGASAS